MVKVDVISGFLGAGKTTFIKKLVTEVFKGEKIILIENEFGEIGIDGGFLQDAGIEITEMNSGCICCTLVGDFAKSLEEVIDTYSPDRVIIEPSGVGKLSDVEKAIVDVKDKLGIVLDSKITVADGKKAKMYIKNFGEFYNNQIESANVIVLSRTQMMSDEKIEECLKILKELNDKANIITTPWDELSGEAVISAVTNFDEENKLMEEALKVAHEHEHHHHHHDHDGECCCEHDHEHEHHHHDHDEECTCGHHHDHEHEHHHHDHDEECTCGHHHDHEHEHHHHDHDEECSCGHHHHHHHDGECCCGHDHDADEVFETFGTETVRKFNREKLEEVLETFADGSGYGVILRAKGVLKNEEGNWFEFDLVPGEYEIRDRAADYTGKVCVIGTNLAKDKLEEFFK